MFSETEADARFYKDLRNIIGRAADGKSASTQDENTRISKGSSTSIQSDNLTSAYINRSNLKRELPKVHQVEHYHKFNLQVEYLTQTVSRHPTEETMVKVCDWYSGDIDLFPQQTRQIEQQEKAGKTEEIADDRILMGGDISGLLKKYSRSHIARRTEYV